MELLWFYFDRIIFSSAIDKHNVIFEILCFQLNIYANTNYVLTLVRQFVLVSTMALAAATSSPAVDSNRQARDIGRDSPNYDSDELSRFNEKVDENKRYRRELPDESLIDEGEYNYKANPREVREIIKRSVHDRNGEFSENVRSENKLNHEQEIKYDRGKRAIPSSTKFGNTDANENEHEFKLRFRRDSVKLDDNLGEAEENADSSEEKSRLKRSYKMDIDFEAIDEVNSNKRFTRSRREAMGEDYAETAEDGSNAHCSRNRREAFDAEYAESDEVNSNSEYSRNRREAIAEENTETNEVDSSREYSRNRREAMVDDNAETDDVNSDTDYSRNRREAGDEKAVNLSEEIDIFEKTESRIRQRGSNDKNVDAGEDDTYFNSNLVSNLRIKRAAAQNAAATQQVSSYTSYELKPSASGGP